MISRTSFSLGLAVIALTAVFAKAQNVSEPPLAYEIAPVFQASAILKPEYFQGPHHQVSDLVATYSGRNAYIVQSDYGVFNVYGNFLLQERVQEINAIAKLKEMSKGKEYTDALARAATKPLDLASHLAKDPVGTVSSVPKGLWKMINQVSQKVQKVAHDEQGAYDGNAAQNLLGVSAAKRALAVKLGVDVYSSNEVLQKELNGAAWTIAAGGSTVDLILMGVTGGASKVVTGIQLSTKANAVSMATSPEDLKKINQDKLVAMGISPDLAQAFLDSDGFSPRYQTDLVESLNQLVGVQGRDAFLRLALDLTEDEEDAIFYSRTAAVMAKLHTSGHLLNQVILSNGLPVCLKTDGSVVVALEWDYAAWTPMAAKFAEAVKLVSLNPANPACLVAISGEASPGLKNQLQAHGMQLLTRLDPGPLK